jgi:hypothetical protein
VENRTLSSSSPFFPTPWPPPCPEAPARTTAAGQAAPCPLSSVSREEEGCFVLSPLSPLPPRSPPSLSISFHQEPMNYQILYQ